MLGAELQTAAVVAVFATVYLGMFLGGLPMLKLDRAGVALLGGIAVIAITGETVPQAAKAIDLPTVVLLFAFMVVSAQLRMSGFYAAVAGRVATMPLSRPGLLAALIAVAAALSAVFSNDVVCLAMTPVVARLCLRRGLPPLPFLLGLACAANIGSAATLIGNPQTMLIGSVLQLSFSAYLRQALPPVMASLLLLWAWLAYGPGARGVPDARVARDAPDVAKALAGPHATGAARGVRADPSLDAWQTAKGLAVSCALMLVFVATAWPRDIAALVGAALLLLSRRLKSAEILGGVDWSLLLLFMGLFVVNHAFDATGLAGQAVVWLSAHGVQLGEPGPLLVVGVALSNLVSNVPAVMLLLPHLHGSHAAGVTLALVCTFAGNLLLVGSIANLIMVDLARQAGIHIGWRQHVRTGLPVAAGSLLLLWAWLRWGMG